MKCTDMLYSQLREHCPKKKGLKYNFLNVSLIKENFIEMSLPKRNDTNNCINVSTLNKLINHKIDSINMTISN